jgi:hypothetical protein
MGATLLAVSSERVMLRAVSHDIRRRQLDGSVLLIKAVGGGWDTTQLPKL